jgi:hypothetical protein
MVNINIAINDDLHKRLRIAAALQDTSQKDLIIAYLAAYAVGAANQTSGTTTNPIGVVKGPQFAHQGRILRKTR